MGVPTSFKSINSTGVGWMPGELIAMFARPTIGKTWMCVHAAATAVHSGFRTLFVSTEMTSSAISMRLDVVLAHMMGYKLSHKALRHGNDIDEEEYTKFLTDSNRESLLMCDHISGQVGISAEAIAGLVRKHNPEFVVIDGVYLISSGDPKKAAWEQSHALFYGLKNLATSTNTPVLVSTQATREASNMFTPPRADQVAFGDALIRASDVAMAMCALEDEDNKRLVQFQKYRDGELTKDLTVMQWNVDNGNIIELPDYEWGEF
jgi:replicative DNA helicase